MEKASESGPQSPGPPPAPPIQYYGAPYRNASAPAATPSYPPQPTYQPLPPVNPLSNVPFPPAPYSQAGPGQAAAASSQLPYRSASVSQPPLAPIQSNSMRAQSHDSPFAPPTQQYGYEPNQQPYQPYQQTPSAPNIGPSYYSPYQSAQYPGSAPTPEQNSLNYQQYSTLGSYPPQQQSASHAAASSHQPPSTYQTLEGDYTRYFSSTEYSSSALGAPAQVPPAAVADTLRPESLQTSEDPLARILVQDGEDPPSFTSAKALAHYIQLFPEAENDQACRVFKYGPNCPTTLLMPLFEHFDFPRYSLFPYGLSNDFSLPDPWKAGFCKCDNCSNSEPCGHHVLFKNFRFFLHKESTLPSTASARVSTSEKAIEISNGSTQHNFRRSDWNIQIFRFRSRRVETTEYAFDALIYQDYDSVVRLRSAPLDYILSQLDLILMNWDMVINASQEFLASFRLEVLQERLETDRSIIRNLLVAAQHWEEFRTTLRVQVQSIEFLENVSSDPRWVEGRDDYLIISAVAAGYVQRFKALDYRITVELQQETDTLIQRVTNLITIDEGYRSRDQNASVWRLTWITVIFLPLVFTAGLFGMNVDLFKSFPSWTQYVYTSLVVIFLVVFGYAAFRSRRRVGKYLFYLAGLALLLFYGIFKAFLWLPRKLASSSIPAKDYSKLPSDPEKDAAGAKNETNTVLKWAACSGRTEVVRQILTSPSSKNASGTLDAGTSGQALVMATQNGHIEAATLLIDTGEGFTYADDKGATALHYASRLGLHGVVELLLQRGASQEARDHDGETPLDYAMEGNHEPTIDLLLKRGKNANKQGTAEMRSLHFSARTGDLETLKELHKNGSSFDNRDGKGQTALFHAVKGKQHETVRWLLDNGANVQAVDKEGLTALHDAAATCDLQCTEILLGKGANVDALSVQNLTPLLCIPGSQGLSVAKLLQSHGANINAMDKSLNRITHRAAAQGDGGMPLLQVLRDLGADLQTSGSGGNTPPHLAAEAGSVRVLQLLGNAGCDLLRTRNIDGYTPLMSAARGGKANTMRFLLDKGANYNVVDRYENSLVELTIRWGNTAVMQVLQDVGVSYSSSSTSGASGAAHPIWAAIRSGLDAPVEKILDAGLSPEYRHDGKSLLHLALEVSNLPVIRLLLDRGASPTLADDDGWTPLHSTAFSGNVEATLLILQRLIVGQVGTDWLPKDHQDWTPLDLAHFYRHDDVVKVLDPTGSVESFAWMRPRVGIQVVGLSVHSRPPDGESVVPGRAEAPSPTR